MEIFRTCRICLRPNDLLVSLFDGQNLTSKISNTFVMDFQILPYKRLPSGMCFPCMQELMSSVIFLEKIRASNDWWLNNVEAAEEETNGGKETPLDVKCPNFETLDLCEVVYDPPFESEGVSEPAIVNPYTGELESNLEFRSDSEMTISILDPPQSSTPFDCPSSSPFPINSLDRPGQTPDTPTEDTIDIIGHLPWKSSPDTRVKQASVVLERISIETLERYSSLENRPESPSVKTKKRAPMPNQRFKSKILGRKRKFKVSETCEVCLDDKVFHSETLFLNHISIHDNYPDLKKFELRCTVCDEVCLGKAALKKHENLHQPPFDCTCCGRVYQAIRVFKAHVSRYHSKW